MLNKKELKAWIDLYDFSSEENVPKNVSVIMAGNIPLVGFMILSVC